LFQPFVEDGATDIVAPMPFPSDSGKKEDGMTFPPEPSLRGAKRRNNPENAWIVTGLTSLAMTKMGGRTPPSTNIWDCAPFLFSLRAQEMARIE
jgi:hypothetical protein